MVEDVLEGHIHQWFDVFPDNKEMYTHTARIVERLQTYAGIRADKQLEMRLSVTLHSMGLARARREIKRIRGSGYYGIAPNQRG
jgi:hypothetical protein